MNRQNFNKRKKKKSKFKKVSFVILVLFLGLSGYIYYQYSQGLQQASGKSTVSSDETAKTEFNGADKEKMDKVNILLLGVDSRGEEKSRTDTIMIAQYDPENQKAKLVSLMRDIYVEIPNNKNYKINTAYFLGGPELLRQTIKQNFDIDIHYYAVVDFKGFESVVDTLAPNGIEMEVEKRMSENIGLVLQPGFQNLNGKEILGYARFRSDASGDFGRVERQQKVVNALKDEIISVNGVTKLPKIVGTIQPYIDTNLEGLDLLAVVKDFFLNPPADIETLRIPVDQSYTMGSYEHAGSVLEIDFDENKQAIDQFLNDDQIISQNNSTNQTQE
ncbi:LCP family protein required for cell wall assembly [Neobacillus niacini]|uniref:LCP family protein n=1 Tax=Neobacillus niacini TaxID=86668 RepID=UPI00285ABB24|nr:LCP family protein [Neobacillus niacini]MDR7078847.1 LCP family protein required for cell wall assembly [Neobacillus niacini]